MMYQVYQIMPGDTLEKIANRYGTTLNNLISINGIDGQNSLTPGTYIVVPKLEKRR